MEKETKVTAEEAKRFIYSKYPHLKNPIEGKNPIIDCELNALCEWLYEYSDLKCAPLIKRIEELERDYKDVSKSILSMTKLYQESLQENIDLKQQADKMAEVLEKLSNCVNAYPSMQYEKSLIVEALTNYKQTKH